MPRDLLRREGVSIGRRHVATLMKRMGIEAIHRRPNTSKPAPGHKIYPYPPRGKKIEKPNHVWAMDIAYIPMARGFVYLAAVVDWASRRVVSHRASITMEADFCVEALEEALAKYGKPEVFNTDQGSQFPKSAMSFWTPRSCGVDGGFQPSFVLRGGTGALAGRAIAILSIVFGFGEAFFVRLPGQRLL